MIFSSFCHILSHFVMWHISNSTCVWSVWDRTCQTCQTHQVSQTHVWNQACSFPGQAALSGICLVTDCSAHIRQQPDTPQIHIPGSSQALLSGHSSHQTAARYTPDTFQALPSRPQITPDTNNNSRFKCINDWTACRYNKYHSMYYSPFSSFVEGSQVLSARPSDWEHNSHQLPNFQWWDCK